MPETVKPQPAIESDIAEFISLLVRTGSDLRRAGPPPVGLREALERAALGKRHMPALMAVAAAGPISVTELAHRVGLLLSTTSTIVGQLSRAGLVVRAEDEQDRRRTIVQLHPDYRDAMDVWLVRATKPVRDTFEALTQVERERFMATWRTLSEHAAHAGEGEQPGDCDA